MYKIPLEQIHISEDRQRREFDSDALLELANSIRDRGLIHPIVLRDGEDTLVAGERRLRALKILQGRGQSYHCNGEEMPSGVAACTRHSELDELGYKEAELSENVHRVNLTLQERAAAISALHALRSEQTDGGQTLMDTATEILGHRPSPGMESHVVKDMILINKYKDDPDVKKATSQSRALKIIKKKTAQEHQRFLAEHLPSHSKRHKLIQGDIREVDLGDQRFDVIITDPPYGESAHKFGSQTLSGGHTYEDSPEAVWRLLQYFAGRSIHLAKEAAHLYLFCDIRSFHTLKLLFEESEWTVWPTPLIWNKGNGMLPAPEYGPRRCYEAILFARRGGKKVLAEGQSDVISIPGVFGPRHPAEKPAEVFVELLRRVCVGGEFVLDPFCGSGPIFPAANKLGLSAYGVEQDPTWVGLAQQRMEAVE